MSVAAHLALLAVLVFHNPRVIDLSPAWLAYGDGAHTYQLTYFPPAAQSDDTPPDTAKLLFRHGRASRAHARSPSRQSLRQSLSRSWPTRKPAIIIPTPDLRWAP
ncbi:MAG TPA: hypothetical protein VE957_10730 [Terriglobales bacterium]|nr:hypothetical protein [Terriglobales bacterium]